MGPAAAATIRLLGPCWAEPPPAAPAATATTPPRLPARPSLREGSTFGCQLPRTLPLASGAHWFSPEANLHLTKSPVSLGLPSSDLTEFSHFFPLCVCMLAHIHVRLLNLRVNDGCLPLAISTLFFDKPCFLLNLELTNSARLASQ